MSILRYLISLVLDFIRWSQMVPMIFAWAFILLALVLMTFINFQQTSVTIVEWVADLWQRYAWLPDWDLSAFEQADGSLRITDEQLSPAILKVWGVISLALLIIDLLRTALIGHREPKPLSRKLLIAAIACAVIAVGFLLNYWLGNEPYDGGVAGWIALFIGGPLLVWLISAYSLSVGHILNRISSQLINTHDDSGRMARY